MTGPRSREVTTLTTPTKLSHRELLQQEAAVLPERETMDLISLNLALPINAAVAANVLTDASTAVASATQAADIGQLGLVDLALDLDLEALALADLADPLEAQPGAGPGDRLALGVQDLGLEHDVNHDAGHRSSTGKNGYATGPPFEGRLVGTRPAGDASV
jgi:hypothetical protein